MSGPSRKAAVRDDRNKLEAIQSEVLADAAGPLLVQLVPGTSVRVLPPRMWRVSSLKALKGGDFDEWAKKALASTEDYETFCRIDPTLEQVETFMKAMNEAAGGN